MIGRGKRLQPRGGNRMQSAAVHGAPAKGLRMMKMTGKVFRKNAGFPWRRATQLG